MPAKGTKFVPRAGKRKCIRCREVWHRTRGDKCTLCPRCQTHCYRCDVELTEETRGNPYVGSGQKNRANTRRNYICKACNTECSKFIRDNKGGKEQNRDRHLVKTYGITSIEYDDMLKCQGGVCWICQRPPKEGGRRLSVDHLHSKGENKRNPREKRGRVRGLLCWHCNSAIGAFKDDVMKLRRAADFLEQWPAQAVLKKEKT